VIDLIQDSYIILAANSKREKLKTETTCRKFWR